MQRLLALHPEWVSSLLLIVEQTSRGEFVLHRNRVAGRRGIRVGMPVSEVRSLLQPRDPLVLEAPQPDEDRRALGELAQRCEPYSPCIGLEEAEQPESLLLDITGVDHFFSGEGPLAKQLERAFHADRFEVRVAIADTIGAAWGAAHVLARSRQPVIIPRGEFGLLRSLPVAGLRLTAADLKKLRRLGITTIGQLVELDRAALLARFGTGILHRIDQFLGERPERMTPYVPPPRFQVERALEEGVIHPFAIERLWSTLLKQLLAGLREKRLGTRHIESRFVFENRRTLDMTIRLCQTTADERHIGELLRLKLERVQWESPIVRLSMEARDVASIEFSQHELLAEPRRDQSQQLANLLNRFSTRLGEEAVVRPLLLPDPVPERNIRYVPVTEGKLPCATTFHAGLLPFDRPTALFPKPRAVHVAVEFRDGPPVVLSWNNFRFEIASCEGPERIESGWWSGDTVRRDYFWVHTTEGRWLWLFQRLQDRRWFWHGEVL